MTNALLSVLAADLEANGCIARFRNARSLEVYGINLSEHYLLTLTQSPEGVCDLLFVPSVPTKTRTHKPVRSLIPTQSGS